MANYVDCRKCKWYSEKFDVDDNGDFFDYHYCEGYGIMDADWCAYCEQFEENSEEE